jgi:hypothetical protein
MKRTVIFAAVVLTVFIIDIYTGSLFLRQVRELKRRLAPIIVKILKDEPPRMLDRLDADDDGKDEVAHSVLSVFPNKQHVSVFELIDSKFHQEYYGDITAPVDAVFFDIYFNRQLNTYVFRFLKVDMGELYLMEIDNRQNLQSSLAFEKPGQQFTWKRNGFKKPQTADLDGDGKKELIIILHSAFPNDPRGVVCYDPGSRKLLWEYPSGALLEKAVFNDLDRDGKKEILLTTYAANNNIRRNGTSDLQSYVIVLDSKGKELWKQKTGDYKTYSHCTVADLEEDGKLEIVAASESFQRWGTDYGKLFIFDAVSGKQKHTFPAPIRHGISFTTPYVREHADSGYLIYVGDTNGGLWMLDKHLVPLKKIAKKGPLYLLNNTSSLSNWNYLYVKYQNRLRVFDPELEREIFSMDFEPPFEFFPVRSVGGHDALIRSDKSYWLKEVKFSFSRKAGHWIHTGALFTLLFLLLFNGFIVYTVFRWHDFILPYWWIKERKVYDVEQFYEIVRTIAHQVKNPLSTILWTAEKIKRDSAKINETETGESLTQLADFLAEDVKTLKQFTRYISGLVQAYSKPPVFKEVNIKPMLQQVIERISSLQEKKPTVHLTMDRDYSLAVDEELLKAALISLLDHALNAMPGSHTLTISVYGKTSYFKGRAKTLIILMEIGPGALNESKPVIDRDNIAFLIGGRVISAHCGKIEIGNLNGSGTKIAITIPVKRIKKDKQLNRQTSKQVSR